MTLDDLDPANVWPRLRATRAAPPAAATTHSKRTLTYTSALEQAEQLFRAAENVGQATRPILIFYGLSQAGRAIAAASPNLQHPDWRLEGHGLSDANLSGPIGRMIVKTDAPGSKGSFAKISGLLDSPLWGTNDVTLPYLWDCLPENRETPLIMSTDRRCPLAAVNAAGLTLTNDTSMVQVENLPAAVTAPGSEEQLSEFMSAYPDAAHYRHARMRMSVDGAHSDYGPATTGEPPAFTVDSERGQASIMMQWRQQGAGPVRAGTVIMERARPYGGNYYFFPGPEGSDRGLHPLMVWWAVLYTLSKLARYQPAEWQRLMNVDRWAHAVQFEWFLARALTFLPMLIAQTIDEVGR